LVALSLDPDLALGMATLGILGFLEFNTDWLVYRVLGYSSSVSSEIFIAEFLLPTGSYFALFKV
jgi:hypothetical protein